MDETTYQAIVVNGQIQLPASVNLPENTKVLVVVPAANATLVPVVRSPRLAHPEQAVDFLLTMKDAADAGV